MKSEVQNVVELEFMYSITVELSWYMYGGNIQDKIIFQNLDSPKSRAYGSESAFNCYNSASLSRDHDKSSEVNQSKNLLS